LYVLGGELGHLGSAFLGGGGLGGGLGGLLGGLRAQGLDRHVDSWVSPGPNHPVSPRELEAAFDRDELDRVAQQAGTDRNSLLEELSRMLPGMVDRMTPQGRLPEREEELHGSGGLGGLLGGLLGGGAAGSGGGGGLASALESMFGGHGNAPEAGTGAAGGAAAPYGGVGGDAGRAGVGRGAGGESGMPRFSEDPPGRDDLSGLASGPGGPPLRRG
jgi:uncharacterized protein YidB (DUF937 family)